MANDAFSYGELLLDPRWQRKRLEIMQRDGFACTQCGATDKTLHVHHHFYIRDRRPWEYAPECLSTLCELCHHGATVEMDLLREALTFLRPADVDIVAGFVSALSAQRTAHAGSDDAANYTLGWRAAIAGGLANQDVDGGGK